MKDSLSAIHVVPSLDPKFGGPSRTVASLADYLSYEPGLNVILLSQGLTNQPTVLSRSAEVDRRICTTGSRYSIRLGLPVKRELERIITSHRIMLIHSHGLWAPVAHWAAKAARQLGVPLLIHTRGMLGPWALGQKAGKKRLAMALYQRRDLESASTLVATSSEEYRSIRAVKFGQPIAVIPNGVELNCHGRNVARARVDSDERVALFLSRIHPEKGLLNLVRAWAEVRPAGWRLHIAGPDDYGHLRNVMQEVEKLRIESAVDYLGEVDGAEKDATYRKADLFVLPTYSENFGVVVAEALARGVPVITTRGAPWSDLETYGCGWWIDTGVEPLVQSLRRATSKNDDELRAMGDRGREYVTRYDWRDIARRTADLYRWLLGFGARPDDVHLD